MRLWTVEGCRESAFEQRPGAEIEASVLEGVLVVIQAQEGWIVPVLP